MELFSAAPLRAAVVDLAEGTAAVALAREGVERAVRAPGVDPARAPVGRSLPAVFDAPRGVFVTLSRHPDGRLRGCIGFAVPVYPLRTALLRAAGAAATQDPRFPPLAPDELSRTVIEVSLLTLPEVVPGGSARRIVENVVVGRDGLIVDRRGASGLLLPQVAVEQGWDPEEFLAETCRKAGLPPDAWGLAGTTIRRFRAERFRETAPGGPVVAEPSPGGPGPAGA